MVPKMLSGDKTRINYLIERLITIGIKRADFRQIVQVKFEVIDQKKFFKQFDNSVVDLSADLKFTEQQNHQSK